MQGRWGIVCSVLGDCLSARFWEEEHLYLTSSSWALRKGPDKVKKISRINLRVESDLSETHGRGAKSGRNSGVAGIGISMSIIAAMVLSPYLHH